LGEVIVRRLGKINNQNGAALVEFAIVLPLLLILIFGIIEFSVMLYDKAMLTNATREGTRAAILFADDRPDPANPDPAEYDLDVDNKRQAIKDVVNQYCKNNLITFGDSSEPLILSIDVQPGPCESSADNVTVSVIYKYTFLVFPKLITAFFSGSFSDPFTISARTVMRCE
jgi:Flp pilus assembly protein TadG